VHVLENLSDPGKLGHLIAGAFVATLWGVMTANVLWLPMSARAKRLSDLECAQMEMSVEGILAIQAGANPRVVAQKLRSLLPPGTASQAEAA
jgi:chemotaxis protein MotA